jgi:DNA repair exonuclease SbcCD ATPase subunit
MEMTVERLSCLSPDDKESLWDEVSVSLHSLTMSESGSSVSDFVNPLTLDSDGSTNPVLLKEDELEDLKTIIGEGNMPDFFQSPARLLIACAKALQMDSSTLQTRTENHAELIKTLHITTKGLCQSQEEHKESNRELFGKLFKHTRSFKDMISSQGMAIRRLFGQLDATQKNEKWNQEQIESLSRKLESQAETMEQQSLALKEQSTQIKHMEGKLDLFTHAIDGLTDKWKQMDIRVSILAASGHVACERIEEVDKDLWKMKGELCEAATKTAQDQAVEMNEIHEKLATLEDNSYKEHGLVETAIVDSQEEYKFLLNMIQTNTNKQRDMDQTLTNEIVEIYKHVEWRSEEQKRVTDSNWASNQEHLETIRNVVQAHVESTCSVLEGRERTTECPVDLRNAQNEDREVLGGMESALSTAQQKFCDTWEEKVEELSDQVHKLVHNLERLINMANNVKTIADQYHSSFIDQIRASVMDDRRSITELKEELESTSQDNNQTRHELDIAKTDFQAQIDVMSTTTAECFFTIKQKFETEPFRQMVDEACGDSILVENSFINLALNPEPLNELHNKVTAIENNLDLDTIDGLIIKSAVQTMENNIEKLGVRVQAMEESRSKETDEVVETSSTIMMDERVWELLEDMKKRIKSLETYKRTATGWAHELHDSLTLKFDTLFKHLDRCEVHETTATQYAQNLRSSVDLIEEKLLHMGDQLALVAQAILALDADQTSDGKDTHNELYDSGELDTCQNTETQASPMIRYKSLLPVGTLRNRFVLSTSSQSSVSDEAFSKQWQEVETTLAARAATNTSQGSDAGSEETVICANPNDTECE